MVFTREGLDILKSKKRKGATMRKKLLGFLFVLLGMLLGYLLFFVWISGLPATHEAREAETITTSTTNASSTITTNSEETMTTTTSSSAVAEQPFAVALTSNYGILKNILTNQIIAEKSADAQIYPASMTKILTALLVVEQADLDEKVVIPAEILPRLIEEGASMCGFEAQEEVTMRDLIYGILFISGADATEAAVLHTSGSEAAFVELMNKTVQTIGMTDTHFTNSVGLHDDDHYSTVTDIELLLEHALQNETFYQILTDDDYTTSATAVHPEGIYFENRTKHPSTVELNIAHGQVLGGKPGYTEEATLCLASLAEINGDRYILVTADAGGDPNSEPFHVLDMKHVFEKI